jgi:hypothetical protein
MNGNTAATTYIAPNGAITFQNGKLAYTRLRQAIPTTAGIIVMEIKYLDIQDIKLFSS